MITRIDTYEMNQLWKLVVAAIVLALLAGCEREKDRLDAEVRQQCTRDGGIKVYEKVKLASDKYDKFGVPVIPSKSKAKPEDEYFYDRDVQYLKKGNPEVWRSHHRLIRRNDGKIIGESIHYTRRGGDMPGPWHESSFTCPEIGTQPSLEQLVFYRE